MHPGLSGYNPRGVGSPGMLTELVTDLSVRSCRADPAPTEFDPPIGPCVDECSRFKAVRVCWEGCEEVA